MRKNKEHIMLKKTLYAITTIFVMIFTLTSCDENTVKDDPQAIGFTVNPIEPTNYFASPKEVYPLVLTFSGSAAPLEMMNKPLKDVKIEPEIRGTWKWQNDTMLTFQPENDWVAGEHYKIYLNDKILNPKIRYKQAVKQPITVETTPFSANIENSEFYQDPNQAHIRQSIVQVNFSHPVDRKKFEQSIQVNLMRKNQDKTYSTISPLKFKIRYSENDLSAWISSDNINLATSNNQVIETKILKNFTALWGKNELKEDLVNQVIVPTKFSLSLNSNISIVNNEKNLAEQILRLNFNHSVRGKEVMENLRAFLLPKENPKKGNVWYFNQVTQEVLNNAEEIQLDYIPNTTTYSNVHNFRIDVPDKRCLYLYVTNNISAMGGYQLSQPVGEVVCAPNYPKYVGFVGKGSLLSTFGDQRLTFSARNFKHVQLEVGKVQAEQLRHIAALNSGDFQNPNLEGLKFDHIATFKTKTYTINNKKPQEASYFSANLAESINNDPKTKQGGVYWVKVTGYDEEPDNLNTVDNSQSEDWRNDELNQYTDYRLVVVSDLGIIAKKATDGSQIIFVQSIRSGMPVLGANVSIIGRNGDVIQKAYTNENGMVTFGNLENYTKSHYPVMYLVTTIDQMSFLPINQYSRNLDYSRFDIDGVMVDESEASLKSYLFNDRGIYRPGETVHIGALTKSLDWKTELTNVPLQLSVVSPSGFAVFNHTLRLDKSGLNSVSFNLPENAETGEWSVDLLISYENNQISIGSNTFQVQEFQPDTLKIKASFNQSHVDGWVSPSDLVATVNVTNLFGTPAQNRNVNANLVLHSLLPKFSQYKDYHFFDNQRNKSSILYETELNSQKTDAHGIAEFPIDLSQYAENTTQMLYFTADGFENESGRSVSTVKSIMVSAQPWLLGYKNQNDLAYLKQNSEESVHFLAINPKLEAVAVEKLKATLMTRNYVSVLTQQSSGAYKYESQLAETEVEQTPINLSQSGLDFKLNTQKSGDFVLVLTNEHDQEVNRIYYTVVGNKDMAVSMDKNTELKLRLNKKQFQPNEEIEIAIQAPYAGSGLITIERDRVYAYKWFNATTNSSIQRIQIPENFEGSGYINVQFSRDIDSDDIFSSPLSYGVVPFSVNVDNRRLQLALNAPKMVKAGETVEFKLSSNKPGKAIVYAVNEGILQVSGYKFTDPLRYFFPKPALQVKTSQILDLLLPEFSKVMRFAQTGGDIGEEMGIMAKLAMANTNPFKRKADKPVAYWSDVIDLNGDTSVKYQVPESFNGNLKVMAIAVSEKGNQIGKAESNTVVRSDLILSPNMPLTLTPTDQSEMNLTIANNTKMAQRVTVKVESDPQVAIEGEKEKIVDIAAMSEGVVSFGLKATDTLGVANIKVTATYQNEQQQTANVVRNMSLSVRPIMTQQFVTKIGRIDAGEKVTQTLPVMLFPQYRQQHALMSPVPLALTQGIATYLAQYDNYCTEQMISAAIPTLLFAQNKEYQPLFKTLSFVNDKQLSSANSAEIQTALDKLLSILPSRQNEFGAYGVWNNLDVEGGFLTAYVSHFLIEAQERQVRLPKAWFGQYGLFNKTIEALEAQSTEESEGSLSELRDRAYSAYLLTRLGQVPSNALMSIRSALEHNFEPEDWQNDSSTAWLAAAYKMLKQDDQANALIEFTLKQLNKPRKENWAYENYNDPLIKDSTMLYVIARHFPQHLNKVGDVVIERIAQDLNQQRYNTLSSAMVLLALDAYGQHNQAQVANLKIQVANQDVDQDKGIFRLAELKDNQADVSFINQSQQPVWFALSQQGYPQQADEKALSNGLEIHRTYTDKDGKPVTSVKRGDVINVTVKVRTASDFVSDVVITDLYPAGFEVIWQSDVEEGETEYWSPTHYELREDRIISYGDVGSESNTFVYQLKAVNAGTYQIPPAYAESMYDRSIKAYTAKEKQIKVEK